jgi:hypothetical protein
VTNLSWSRSWQVDDPNDVTVWHNFASRDADRTRFAYAVPMLIALIGALVSIVVLLAGAGALNPSP